MGSRAFFEGLGDLFTNYLFVPFEMIGDVFNWAVVALGFVGLFFWLNTQKKLSDKAAKEGKLK
jgi:hypothetical protein